MAAAFIKRRAADMTKGWDDKVTNVPLTTMITEVVARMHQEDPVRGKWCVDGTELDVWVDASSLVTGVLLYTQHNKDERHSLLEKYTSHFNWKGCVWEGVGDRTELQQYWS